MLVAMFSAESIGDKKFKIIFGGLYYEVRTFLDDYR
jgi:hypothetical protein